MTTEELITRAQHAARTNQPRLARLYMRQALHQVDQHRRQLNPRGWERRRQREALRSMGRALQEAGKAWVTMFEALAEALQPAPPRGGTQNDYALAAPQEG